MGRGLWSDSLHGSQFVESENNAARRNAENGRPRRLRVEMDGMLLQVCCLAGAGVSIQAQGRLNGQGNDVLG